MNRILNSSLLLVALSVSGVQAFADDAKSPGTPTSNQMMKDCIEKQKATDVSMSKADVKRLCKDQLKQQKKNGVLAEPPPVDTPHN
jgi:hypothetical protein